MAFGSLNLFGSVAEARYAATLLCECPVSAVRQKILVNLSVAFPKAAIDVASKLAIKQKMSHACYEAVVQAGINHQLLGGLATIEFPKLSELQLQHVEAGI